MRAGNGSSGGGPIRPFPLPYQFARDREARDERLGLEKSGRKGGYRFGASHILSGTVQGEEAFDGAAAGGKLPRERLLAVNS